MAMVRLRRTVGQLGHAADGPGQSVCKSFLSVLSAFVNLSCVGAAEVVVFSTHVGFVTCFPHLLTLNVWLKNICARWRSTPLWAVNFFVVSMAFALEQFNVIVEMVKQITLAQYAVWTPTDPLGLCWNNVAG